MADPVLIRIRLNIVGSMKKYTFFELVDLSYSDARLTVRVAKLVKGKPDGYIGTPLVIGPQSRHFIVYFDGVTEFRSKAEPCFVAEGDQVDLSDFVFECLGSEYVRQVCPFGSGAKEPARHFCVFTESVVVEVLTSNEPRIEAADNTAQQGAGADALKTRAPQR